MRKSFILFKTEWNRFKTFLENKYKDFLAVFICLFIVIISSFLIGKADSGAKVQFTADAIISLSGADITLYALTGSEADSITVSGSTLTVDIPNNSSFTIGTTNYKVLKITPSGNAVSLIFDTVYLSSGYVSQWTVSSSATNAGVSFLVGVPEANADYLVKANGEKLNYYKSSSAKEISFSYTGDLTRKAFEVIRENQPVGTGLPSAAFQAPAPPKQGFSILINNGAEKTTKREVTLTLNGGPDAKRMSVSESRDFTNASQELYTTSKTWTLSEGYGVKTVYVKFFTEYGQPTEAVSDSIVLETATLQQQLQEEPETDKVIIEEPVIAPPATKQQTVKEEQPKPPIKVITQKETTSPSTKNIPPAKITVPAKEPIMPKIIVDDTPSSSADEKVADDEITSSVEPKIIPEEQTVSHKKNNNESVNTEKSILASFWQAVVSLLRRMWPF